MVDPCLPTSPLWRVSDMCWPACWADKPAWAAEGGSRKRDMLYFNKKELLCSQKSYIGTGHGGHALHPVEISKVRPCPGSIINSAPTYTESRSISSCCQWRAHRPGSLSKLSWLGIRRGWSLAAPSHELGLCQPLHCLQPQHCLTGRKHRPFCYSSSQGPDANAKQAIIHSPTRPQRGFC